MTKNDTIKELIIKQTEYARKFKEESQELLKGVFKEFWDKNPGVTAIIWTQYTPYFNDGDTCEFGVHEPVFTNAKDDDIENVTSYGEYEGDDKSVWAFEGSIKYILDHNAAYYKDTQDKIIASGGYDRESLEGMYGLILEPELEDVFKSMFGDHVRVTATRDGFEVDEYEHD